MNQANEEEIESKRLEFNWTHCTLKPVNRVSLRLFTGASSRIIECGDAIFVKKDDEVLFVYYKPLEPIAYAIRQLVNILVIISQFSVKMPCATYLITKLGFSENKI